MLANLRCRLDQGEVRMKRLIRYVLVCFLLFSPTAAIGQVATTTHYVHKETVAPMDNDANASARESRSGKFVSAQSPSYRKCHDALSRQCLEDLPVGRSIDSRHHHRRIEGDLYGLYEKERELGNHLPLLQAVDL